MCHSKWKRHYSSKLIISCLESLWCVLIFYKIHALVTGPFDTPYEGGLFQFLIRFPPNYPFAPPRVKFLTTGGGLVRFNPNLYQNGKVCLSILGWAMSHLYLYSIYGPYSIPARGQDQDGLRPSLFSVFWFQYRASWMKNHTTMNQDSSRSHLYSPYHPNHGSILHCRSVTQEI